MNGWVLVLGLALLAGVAAGVVLGGELRHRERIRLDAWSWRLWRWEQEIVSAADGRDCPGCRLLRQRSELMRTPGQQSAGLD